MDNKNIFLYVPNLIGYGRLILLAAAFFYMESDPVFFLGFYCSSIILDGFDGYAARKLDQVTTFGAWLDVVIDNLSRAMLWTYIANWGWLVSCLEWIVFVCTHTLGKQWKSAEQSVPPIWVQAVMANGFKTPIGTFVILGLHCLPIWLYLQKNELLDNVFTPCVQAYSTIALSTGRLLCMTVELWFIYNHIQTMAAWDDRPPTPTPTPTPKLDSDDDDDDEYDDGVACDTGDDNIVAEEVKPIVTKPRSEMVVRRVRHKGPSIQPTPGSTIINMGSTPQGRRGSSQDKRGSSQDRRGSTPESPPMRRQHIDEPLQKKRRSPGPLRRRPDPERERPYPPRGRTRGRRPEYMPPYPSDQRPRPPDGSPGGRRRPPRDFGPVDSEGRRRQSPRRLEIDGRIPRPPDGVRRRRRSESPGRIPADNIERRRRRSESPGGRRRLRPMKDPVEREPPELIDGRSLSAIRSSYLEKLQSGTNVRLDVQTKPDNTDKDKSKEDTQVKVKEHDQEEPANTSLSSQQIIQGDGGVKSTLSSQPQSLVAESSLKLKDDREGESKSVTSATVETVKPLDSPQIDEQLPDEDGETSPDQGASPSARRKKRQSVFGKLVRKPKPQVIDDIETGSIDVEGDDNVEHTHSLVKQPARKKRITFSKKKSEKQNDLEETGSVDVNNNQIDEATSPQSTTSPRQKRKSIFKRKKDKRLQNEEGEASEGMEVSKTTSRDDKDDTQSTEGNDTSKQQMTARSGSPSIEIEENKTEIATL